MPRDRKNRSKYGDVRIIEVRIIGSDLKVSYEMRVSYEIFTLPKKLFELRRCSNNRKSNYRESTVELFPSA